MKHIFKLKILTLILAALTALTASYMPAFSAESESKVTGASSVFILMEKKQAQVKDLIDVLTIFKKQPIDGVSYEDKIKALKQSGVIPEKVTVRPEDTLRKGFTALLFHRALNLKGGLLIRLTGTSSRNCLRELAYLNIMPESSDRDKMTGPELVSVLQRAKDYAMNKTDKTNE